MTEVEVKMTMKHTKAFTLIELLIVVAIIAILAAIAVPNFLEAQTRAKVSRVKSDLRTLNTGLEAYRVDTNKYCINTTTYSLFAAIELIPLSTPIAYVTSVDMSDPFEGEGRAATSLDPQYRDTYKYAYWRWTKDWLSATSGAQLTTGDNEPGIFRRSVDAAMLYSLGPAAIRTRPFVSMARWLEGNKANALQRVYDPTNGTISEGAIVRWFGATEGFSIPE